MVARPSNVYIRLCKGLLLGTTGAGKTTVLRQLIGTDPDTERFPTTATGRTTTADTEVITRPGPYEAAVTFYPFDEVREHLADCVLNAVRAAHRGDDRDAVQRALLQHPDQRFRFNYVLGDGRPAPVRRADIMPADVPGSRPAATGMPGLGDIDLEATADLIGEVVDRIIAIASTRAKALRDKLEPTTGEDQRLVDEIFEEEIDALLRDPQ